MMSNLEGVSTWAANEAPFPLVEDISNSTDSEQGFELIWMNGQISRLVLTPSPAPPALSNSHNPEGSGNFENIEAGDGGGDKEEEEHSSAEAPEPINIGVPTVAVSFTGKYATSAESATSAVFFTGKYPVGGCGGSCKEKLMQRYGKRLRPVAAPAPIMINEPSASASINDALVPCASVKSVNSVMGQGDQGTEVVGSCSSMYNQFRYVSDDESDSNQATSILLSPPLHDSSSEDYFFQASESESDGLTLSEEMEASLKKRKGKMVKVSGSSSFVTKHEHRKRNRIKLDMERDEDSKPDVNMEIIRDSQARKRLHTTMEVVMPSLPNQTPVTMNNNTGVQTTATGTPAPGVPITPNPLFHDHNPFVHLPAPGVPITPNPHFHDHNPFVRFPRVINGCRCRRPRPDQGDEAESSKRHHPDNED